MKIFTHLRTIWHEFLMRVLVGPTSVDKTDLKSMPELPKIEFPAYLKPKTEPLRVNAEITICHKTETLFNSEASKNFQEELMLTALAPQSTKKLWVYNVSRVDHKFDHPTLGNVTIPANDTKKRYKLWTSFPDIIIGVGGNPDYSTIVRRDGKEFVEDLIDPDHGCKSGMRTAIGRDFSVRGVFWSYNNPPTTKEVNAAVKPMKNRYADLLERMAVAYDASIINEATILRYRKEHPDASLEEALEITRRQRILPEITPEHHAAAEYCKVTTPWHPVLYS